jgi:hypothetical protein
VLLWVRGGGLLASYMLSAADYALVLLSLVRAPGGGGGTGAAGGTIAHRSFDHHSLTICRLTTIHLTTGVTGTHSTPAMCGRCTAYCTHHML